MKRDELLNEAVRITTGDRQGDYGDPVPAHQDMADMASILIGQSVTAANIATIMMVVKLVRLKTSPHKADNYIDLMAYAGIAAECEARKASDE